MKNHETFEPREDARGYLEFASRKMAERRQGKWMLCDRIEVWERTAGFSGELVSFKRELGSRNWRENGRHPETVVTSRDAAIRYVRKEERQYALCVAEDRREQMDRAAEDRRYERQIPGVIYLAHVMGLTRHPSRSQHQNRGVEISR
jgi:hypothetical protein